MVAVKRAMRLGVLVSVVVWMAFGLSGCSSKKDRQTPETPSSGAQERKPAKGEKPVASLEQTPDAEHGKADSLEGYGDQTQDGPEGLNTAIGEPAGRPASVAGKASFYEKPGPFSAKAPNVPAEGQVQPKEAYEEDPDSAGIGEIYGKWSLQATPARRVQFLESVAESAYERDPAIIPVLEQAIEDPDPEVGILASELVREYESAEILPAIAKALKSNNEQVRLNVLDGLGQVDDPLASELLVLALNDTSEDVRIEAMEQVSLQEGERQLASLSEAMASEYYEIKTEALSLLEMRGDRQSVPIIMEGLKDTDPQYLEEVNSALGFLFDREFGGYDQAMEWWKNNKDLYDENLFEK